MKKILKGGVHNMRKSAWLLSIMLILSLFLAACGKSTNTDEKKSGNKEKEEAVGEPQKGGDLIIGTTGSPTMFNPLYSTDAVSGDVEDMIFDHLIESDPDNEFRPKNKLAESIEESDDGLTYTVKIHEGVKFHDGEELTADDVVFTYSIPLSDDYDGQRMQYFEALESVEKKDDYTIVFKLKKVDAQFHSVGLGFGILPEHILGDVPIKDLGEHSFNTKEPIGSGPFKFGEWKEGEYVKLEANEDYWQDGPYLDTVTFKIIPDADTILAQLQKGEIHFYDAIPQSEVDTVQGFVDAANLKLESGLGLAYTFLGYNFKNELFQDKKVRQAITHALDREAMIENVMNGYGEVAHVPESPLSWAYNPDVPKFEYDVEKAKKLLKEAGWEPGADGILEKDGKKFSFELKTNQGNKIREDLVVIIQEQLKEVGIEVKPQIMEFSALIADIDPPHRKYDAMVLGWSLAVDPDPSGIFHSKEIENGLNHGSYSNPELDKKMEAQLQEKDEKKRIEVIGEIQAELAEEQPYTILYYPEEYRAMPKNMHGYHFHGKKPYHNIHEWWLEQ